MSGTITQGATAFFNSPNNSWVLGTVESLDPKDTYTCKTKTGPGATIGSAVETVSKLKKEDVFIITNAELLEQNPDDLLLLVLLHDSTLMHSLNQRYMIDVIYTYIGPIVVAFNPFKFTIPWYQDPMMGEYLQEGHVIRKNKPHSWAVAHNTYYEMNDNKQDQCILVSGESGAGKTEAVKIVMKYLGAISALKASPDKKGSAEQVGVKLMQASPILEGFGNAKTVRNDNSSRFGKFMKVQFDSDGVLIGADTTKYLLEKSRIVTAGPGERCYHSFYLAVLGKDAAKWGVDGSAANFQSINRGGCVRIDGVDDAGDYAECLSAMTTVGIEAPDQDEIWKTVGGILNILNVTFAQSGDKATMDGKAKECIQKAATLWQIDGAVLEKELLTTTRTARGETFVKEHTPTLAYDSRDALVKALYDELFSWLVVKINLTASVSGSGNFIGLLDIFGFEDFEVNSFEQLCINLANETLQGHYNTYIFEKDMEECRAEGVDVTQVEFPDNTPCLKLVVDKMGLLALLDEECALGKGSDESYLEKVCDQHAKHPFFEKKRLVKDAFIVKHYAGDVSYDIKGFLDKNRDTLKDDMKLLMRSSASSLIKTLLPEPVDKAGKKITVGGFFKNQLADLMVLINSTNPHWIRCIKPHPAKKPLMWHGVQVYNQLSSSGVIGTVKVRKAGFPIRLNFMDFLKRFRLLKPGPLSDPKGTCQGIVTHMKFDRKVCQVGTTRVFLKNEPYNELEEAIAIAAAKYILTVQAWARKHLSGIREQELNFQSNKASIIEAIRSTMALEVEERNARKAIVDEEVADLSSKTFPFVDTMESMGRDRITSEEDALWESLSAQEAERRWIIDTERREAEERRLREEASARDRCLTDEESGRQSIVEEEANNWAYVLELSETEQQDRDRLRDSERTNRKTIEEEEQEGWVLIIQDEQESHQYWKSKEQERLGAEWRCLVEGVHAVSRDRKSDQIAAEKDKYDRRRNDITERRRQRYHQDQLPRNDSIAERSAMEPKAKAIRDHQISKQEGDADVVLQKARERKEILVGQQPGVSPSETAALRIERRHFRRGEENAMHDSLSARTYPHERSSLHTYQAPHLFSQPVKTTSEEIISARGPGSARGSPYGPRSPAAHGSPHSGMGTPRSARLYSPASSAGSPGGPYRSPRNLDFLPTTEPVFSPARTRAAAGLDAQGHPMQPMVPQPNPTSPPKIGSWSPPNSPPGQRRDREYVYDQFGL